MKLNGLIKTIQKLPTIPRIAIYVIIFIVFRFLLDALLKSLRGLKIMKEGMGNMDGKKFVLFHWKNCGHCKKMMPEWEKFETMYKGKIGVGRVEKDEAPKFVEKLGVKGFPTIMLLD
jgi:thiol-disulfide isomerase/thioredoxin